MDAIARLEAEIRRHNRLYFDDNAPEISDDEFDRLVEDLKRLSPDSAVLAEVGAADPPFDGEVWTHTSPMLSLDKCYDEETLDKWAAKFEGLAIESPKVDGCAATFVYGLDGRLVVAATRGNGTEGGLCTEQMRHVAGVPERVPDPNIEVRGEVYMPLSVFNERFADRFANPRNTAAGGIKQKDPSKTRDYGLRFFAYDLLGVDYATEREKFAYLESAGFQPVEWRALEKSEMQAGYEAWEARRDHIDFEIDGVVYKVDDVGQHAEMGATAHHPRYALAYKLKTESRVAKLERVIWSVARTGTVTPVANIAPTNLSGVTVTRVSLHNLGLARNLGVGPNCTVRVTRRGGVIPYIEELVAAGDPLPVPEDCPACRAPLVEEGDFLSCVNGACPAQVLGTLEHYAKAIDADGFGPSILQQALSAGLLRDVDDFYRLTPERLMPLDRLGRTSAQKLYANIQARRTQPLPRFLVSLGIRDLGPTVARTLVEAFPTLAALRAATEEELAAVHGMGDIMAHRIREGLALNAGRIDVLLEFVTLEEGVEALPAPVEGPFQGKSFVFTGKLVAGDRKTAQARVAALGASTPSSVGKELSYLVVGDEGSPLFGEGKKGSKLKKAEKYVNDGASLSIISERDFLAMVSAAEGRQG